MRIRVLSPWLIPLTLIGCSESPTQPTTGPMASPAAFAAAPRRNAPGRPGYEPAYVQGQVVTINAIEVPPVAPEQAQADFYEVVYPIGWSGDRPQCDPCDHQGDGIDFTDFHDHILDSMPSDPGGNEFRAPWHVFLVIPAYTGDAEHNAQVNAAYGAQLPTTSEAAVDALLDTRLGDGSPIAIEIDTHFYFLCAVVSAHAAH